MERKEYINKVEVAEAAARAYYNGTEESELPDNVYDSLVESLRKAGEENGWYEHIPLVEEVAAGVLRVDNSEESRENRMLSLEKIKEDEELTRFFSRFAPNEKLIYEPKLDGFALSAHYKEGRLVSLNTRGDGERGDNILGTVIHNTSIENLPFFIGFEDDLEVRGEVYVTAEGLVIANEQRITNGDKPYSLERSAAAGAVRSLSSVRHVPLRFTAYDAFSNEETSTYTEVMDKVRSLGFQTPADAVPIETEGLTGQEIVAKFGEVINTLGVPMDGLVIKADSFAVRDRLGEGSRHPHWAAAFKYPSTIVETVFRSVRREVGKTGAISYRLEVDPVMIGGSKVSRATGNNAAFIDDLDLHIGDTITIRKANEIIPEVLEVITALRPEGAVKYVAPQTCPKCEEELDTFSSTVWRCLNTECVVLERIVHAASRGCLDISGLSRARAELLIEAELVSTPADLFTLTKSEIANVPTGKINQDGIAVIGTAFAEEIHTSIQAARENAPLEKVLASLGIRNLGKTLSKHLATSYLTIDAILALTEDDFATMVVRGRRLGESIGKRVYADLTRNHETILKMKESGVKALNEAVEVPAAAGNKLEGRRVVISGSIPGHNRDTARELVESNGGVSSSSVSSSTNLLVTDPASTSSKAVKARELGIEILSPEDFLSMLTS